MATLATLSRLRGSDRGRTLLGLLLEHSPLISFLDMRSAFELDATDYLYRTHEGTDGVKTRIRGNDYTETDLAPGDRESGTQAFHGDKIDVDHSDKADADRGLMDLAMWLEKALGIKGRSFARGWENKAMLGSAAANEIKGLSNLLDGATNVPGFTSTMTVDAATFTSAADDSFDLSVEANWSTFIESLIVELAKISANGILLAPEMQGRMHTIAQEKHILGETRDQFGNPVKTFAGYPLVPLRPGAITTTEPDNNATPVNNTTSIYPITAGEGQVSVVTNSGLDFWDLGDLEGEEAWRVKWELRGQWKIQEDEVIRRIRNIKL